MNVTRQIFLILFLVFSVFQIAQASELDHCLARVHQIKGTHIVTREEQVRTCFKNNKKNISANLCFRAVAQDPLVAKSINFKEEMNSFCFYQVAQFSTPRECMAKIQIFSSADNRDEAVFSCYQKFQNQIGRQLCLQMSEQMVFDEKKDHLQNRCFELR